jgi:hypothetical protein
MSSLTFGHEEPTDSSSLHEVKANLEGLLRNPAPIEWTVVNGLLQKLSVVPSCNDFTFTSTKDDPLGRSLVSILLSRNPPAYVLDATLQVFPDSLKHNPVAFFSACRFATPQTITQLMNHSLRTDISGASSKECPYPWILSDHVTAEGAKAMLQACPQGVLQTSSCLSSLCPLDFFLMSPEMIQQRNYDVNMWTKFKLMLVAAECCTDGNCQKQDCGLSPVHVILKRILSRPGMYRHCHSLGWMIAEISVPN